MGLLEETALAFQKGAVDGGLSAGGSVRRMGGGGGGWVRTLSDSGHP
jgi:hypothetical protein